MRDKNLILGVDFGGTKIKAGAITTTGKLARPPVIVPTRVKASAREIFAEMVGAIEQVRNAFKGRRVLGLGVGSPGPLDLEKGQILKTPNIPSMRYFHLRRELQRKLKLPVYVNNDANVFVLGESYFGAAKGYGIVYGVTLGTGFGNGLVINGRNHTGATGTATEVFCTPYGGKIWEDYISGRGVSMLYRQLGGGVVSSLEVYHRARNKEKRALKCWNNFGMHLGRILACVVNLVDPDMIVVGGSISAAYRFFLPSLRQHLHLNINAAPRKHLKIRRATLGDHSGLIGACCLVLQDAK